MSIVQSYILDSRTLQLLCQRCNNSVLLPSETGLQFCNQGVKGNFNTLLLGVSVGKTHLLDTALASSKLLLTENDTKGNGTLLGSLELLGKLGLQLVRELSLGEC